MITIKIKTKVTLTFKKNKFIIHFWKQPETPIGSAPVTCTRVAPFLLHYIVEPHPGGGVQRLAEHGGGDAGEHGGDAVLLHDPHPHGDQAHTRRGVRVRRRVDPSVRVRLEGEPRPERVHGRVALALQLHADLDQVQRVRRDARHDRRDPSLHESLQTHFDFRSILTRENRSINFKTTGGKMGFFNGTNWSWGSSHWIPGDGNGGRRRLRKSVEPLASETYIV